MHLLSAFSLSSSTLSLSISTLTWEFFTNNSHPLYIYGHITQQSLINTNPTTPPPPPPPPSSTVCSLSPKSISPSSQIRKSLQQIRIATKKISALWGAEVVVVVVVVVIVRYVNSSWFSPHKSTTNNASAVCDYCHSSPIMKLSVPHKQYFAWCYKYEFHHQDHRGIIVVVKIDALILMAHPW